MTIVLPTLAVTFAALSIWLTVRIVNRRERWAIMIAAFAIWNAVCLGVSIFFYPMMLERPVYAIYMACFGDIQENYETFERISQYFRVAVATAIATVATIWFLEALTQKTKWRRRAIAFSAWEVAAVAVLVWSYESGFPYKINKLGWSLFGPPEDIYSFGNFVLHRIVAWLLCTTLISLAAIWLFTRDFPKPPRHLSG